MVQALRRAGGNQTRAAALLGLNRDQIRYRIEKFGLSARPNGMRRVVVDRGTRDEQALSPTHLVRRQRAVRP